MTSTTYLENIGIIGLGRMGRCVVKGLLETCEYQKDQIYFTTKHDETGKAVEKELGIKLAKTNEALVACSATIILAVKPQNMGEVIKEIGPKIDSSRTVVSIAASISTSQIEEKLGKDVSVIRAMPNTPAFVREAITALCMGTHAKERDWDRVVSIFKHIGRVVKVDERYMNAVTGLSGCGPAYIYVVMESLTDAGIKVGLPRDLAIQLSAQTVLGAAKMLLETGRHPAALKDDVTTPAGCTIDGLLELEEGGLRRTMIKAVVQATERAESLSKLAKI